MLVHHVERRRHARGGHEQHEDRRDGGERACAREPLRRAQRFRSGGSGTSAGGRPPGSSHAANASPSRPACSPDPPRASSSTRSELRLTSWRRSVGRDAHRVVGPELVLLLLDDQGEGALEHEVGLLLHGVPVDAGTLARLQREHVDAERGDAERAPHRHEPLARRAVEVRAGDAVLHGQPALRSVRNVRAEASAAAIASAPLLPSRASGALPRLLGGVARDQTEPDRHAGVERRERHRPRGLGTDVLEVRRPPADHAAERGQRDVAARLRRLARQQAELEGAGCRDHVDVLGRDAGVAHGVERAVQELLDDLGVVAARDDRDACAGREIGVGDQRRAGGREERPVAMRRRGHVGCGARSGSRGSGTSSMRRS